jgi:hypothetical protein
MTTMATMYASVFQPSKNKEMPPLTPSRKR